MGKEKLNAGHREEGRRKKSTLILCDFDGTISSRDVGFHLLNRVSGGKWERIDRDFVAGRIGSREAYLRMVKDLRGSEEEYLDLALSLGKIDPGFFEFAEFCRQEGLDLKIVSDGFALYIRAFLEKLGLEEQEFFANELVFSPGGKVEASFPNASESCGKCGCCKRRVLRKFREDFQRIIYIGDGISDRCAAVEADLVFAKRSLYQFLLEQGFSVFSFQDFAEVLQIFRFRLKGVVFDLDGTLIDSFQPIFESFRHTLLVLGYDPVKMEEKRNVVGSTLEESLREFVKPEELDRAVTIFRSRYQQVLRSGTELLSGVRETLEGLRELEIPLGVATNKYGPFAREILAFLEVDRYFQEVVGAGDGYPPKPSPEILLSLAERFLIKPSGLAYVGDSPLDIRLGKAAGYQTVAVPTGFYRAEELGREKPSLLLGKIEELVKYARILKGGVGNAF